MRRRQYLLGLITVSSVGGAGCLSSILPSDDRSALTPAEDQNVETVATASVAQDMTPICAEGESFDSNVDGWYAEFVTDHEFFRDTESGRYGIRGRIASDEQRGIPRIYAEFSDGSSAWDLGYRVDGNETYLFNVVTSEGNPDAIDGYTLTVKSGGMDDIGPVPDQYATIDGEWGQIGTYNDNPVYGYTAIINNDHVKDITVYPRLKAYLDETTVAFSGTSIDSVIELGPGNKQTVYFPYLRCDPAEIVDVERWLEWSTMSHP